MAGYVANARLDESVPRFVGGHARPGNNPLATDVLAGGSTREHPGVVDWVELVGRPFETRLAERLASIGEAWSQLTFFLFDPESWR